jgi:uncharacterized integral membrane protein
MAAQRGNSRDHSAGDRVQVERTRTSAAWIAITVAVVFLILLIVFIAENNQSVKISFFGASGHVSEALALVIAAVAGAALVLLIGTGRLLQLRLVAHRHNREARRSEKAAAKADDASAPAEGSAATASSREAQAVDAER